MAWGEPHQPQPEVTINGLRRVIDEAVARLDKADAQHQPSTSDPFVCAVLEVRDWLARGVAAGRRTLNE